MPTVRKLPSGKYQGSYRDAAGRRHTQTWPTRTAAKRWAADGEAAVRSGTHRDPRRGRLLLSEWHERWMRARVVEEATRRTDRTYGKDVLGEFGDWPLDAITRMDVQAWVRRLEQDGRGTSAIHKAHQHLSSVLEEAVRSDRLTSNPARGVRLPAIPRRPDRIITPEEERTLLAALPTEQDRRMVVVLLDTGLRYGELAGLQAHRVNMLRRELHVVEVLTQAGTLKATPKSKRSRRTVPLSDRALEALSVQLAEHGEGLLFRTRRGGRPMVEPNWRRRAWLPAARLLADPIPTPHSTRHTYASRLVASGVDLRTVQDVLGHDSITVTTRYLHAAPDAGERVRSALDGARLAHGASGG